MTPKKNAAALFEAASILQNSKASHSRKTVLPSVKQFRAPRSPLCSKCRKETRKPDQRWGANCMAEYQRNWRKSRTKRFHELEQSAANTHRTGQQG